MKCDGAIGLPKYMFIVHIWCNSALLRGIRSQNLNDIEHDISTSIHVESSGSIRFLMYGFLLLSINNIMPISHRLVIATQQPQNISLIAISKFSTTNEVDWLIIFVNGDIQRGKGAVINPVQQTGAGFNN